MWEVLLYITKKFSDDCSTDISRAMQRIYQGNKICERNRFFHNNLKPERIRQGRNHHVLAVSTPLRLGGLDY